MLFVLGQKTLDFDLSYLFTTNYNESAGVGVLRAGEAQIPLRVTPNN
jgi:hypothetical protein